MEPSNHLGPTDVLLGQETHLRPPRVDDLLFIRMLWADPETMAAVGGPIDLPEAKARDWFARMVEPGGPANCYCLIFNQADVPVGEISFHRWDPKGRTAELNIKVLASHRRHGYGKDALYTFLAWFFCRVGGRTMTDDVAIDNPAGQRLLFSLGFEKDDAVSDVCKMALTQQMYITRYGEPCKAFETMQTRRAPQG
ncbi:GNAT family N-acetyltransferase [bacterium]|nr:GNAT family N-acetyltransferase [bacterium]